MNGPTGPEGPSMQYKCVAYTSLAALDMDEAQLLEIHVAARDLNGIDGISGLLIYNGTHFLQWIEGPPQAIDDLLDRLWRDQRHCSLEVREEHGAGERLFGDWSMELVRVRSPYLHAREDIDKVLPARLPSAIRDRILDMADCISADVDL